MDKRSDPIGIRLPLGLLDELKEIAMQEDRPFSEIVLHMLDKGVYDWHYKFPAHRSKFNESNGNGQENGGRTK